MDILAWIQNNAIAIFLPVLSGFLAWFFSRKREAAEIKRTDAEQRRTLAETDQIAVEAANKAISSWVDLYNEMNRKYSALYAEVKNLEKIVDDYREENIVLRRTVDFLLTAMDKYDPLISKTAKEMLEKR